MDPNTLYEQLGIDKDLVTRFSILFSRFEYALKRAGYAQGDERGVAADWCRFAREHASAFDPGRPPQLQQAVEYLQANPPNKQILRNGVLDWKPVKEENTSLLKQVVDAVKRVRNNLFHGGKFPTRPVEECARNSKLLESCVAILGELLRLDAKVETHFKHWTEGAFTMLRN